MSEKQDDLMRQRRDMLLELKETQLKLFSLREIGPLVYERRLEKSYGAEIRKLRNSPDGLPAQIEVRPEEIKEFDLSEYTTEGNEFEIDELFKKAKNIKMICSRVFSRSNNSSSISSSN